MSANYNPEHAVGHKFRTVGPRLWESLETGQVYFASPEELNDPFDCQLDLASAFSLARKSKGSGVSGIESERWARISSHIAAEIRTCGVFSLCGGSIQGISEQLFWSHYAADHKGVCLTYSIPISFVLEQMIGIAPVQYNTNQLFDALGALDLSSWPDFNKVLVPIITSLLTTKSEAWSYENEFRLVSAASGSIAFDRAWLKQICFGLRTPKVEKLKLMSKVRQLGYFNCQFAEVYVSDRGLFDLALREVVADV